MNISRRNFLGGMAAVGLIDLTPKLNKAQVFGGQRRIVAGPGRSMLMNSGEKLTDLWLYNNSLPGPEIRIKEGELLDVYFQNKLTTPTTIHWHGVKVPNAMDGVSGLTQPAVEPGEAFSYKFRIFEPGTYWYHAHTTVSYTHLTLPTILRV